MSTDNIQLNVLIEGDHPVHGAFKINVSRTEILDDLADLIKSRYLQRTGKGIIDLMMFSCNLPRDQLQNFQTSDENALAQTDEVSSAWPVVPSNHGQLIHVFVKCKIQSLPKLVPQPPLLEPAEELNKAQMDFIKSLVNRSSAQASEIKHSRQQQRTSNYIRNGRPYERTGPPICLYHPVFGQFVSNLRSTTHVPPKTLTQVKRYFPTSPMIYDLEFHGHPDQIGEGDVVTAARDQSTRGQLNELLGSFLSRTSSGGARPDGLVLSRDGACILLMEMKNEIGTGGSDPSVQAAQSYSRVWSDASVRDFLLKCCCPSILIAISGPLMVILGAVFLDRPVVQLLTMPLYIGDEPSLPLQLPYLARVSDSVSKARNTLEDYYSNLEAPLHNSGRFFPYITHYTDANGQRTEFTYLKALSENYPDAGKLVFLAETGAVDQRKPIVIKFVRRYNAKAHTLLAEQQLAPKLLYDGTAHLQDQPGPDYAMIVMEFLHGIDLANFKNYPLPDSVSGDIDNALKCLHDNSFVFGDLRDPNVMIETDPNGEVVGAKLIDFDWCGVHQEGHYPDDMNPYVNWAEGVEPGALMDKRHDMEMKKKLNLVM